ncbi:hypothetical protein AYX15_01458 [Cryptococcus neoformans]|nr:hypothetical protein AYX15_01458 [Cryptococcus neoformans var. grubii]
MTTSADPPAYINAEDLFPWNIYPYENTLKFMRDTSDIASVAYLPVIDDSHPTITFRHDGVKGSRQKYLFVGWKFNDKIREGATQYMVLNGIEDYNSASLSHEKFLRISHNPFVDLRPVLDALILVDRNISVTPNHGPEKTSERFDPSSNSEAKEKSAKADGNAKEKNIFRRMFGK